MSKTKDEKQPTPVGMVVYTDGGAIPNPGAAGCGAHGYTYILNVEDPKPVAVQNPFIVSSDNKVYYMLPTDNGYLECDNKGVLFRGQVGKYVKPTHYYDLCLHFNRPETNNVAELMAAQQVLRAAIRVEHLKDLHMLLDSQYVLNTLESYIRGWKRNGWLKNDGTPPKNLELIKTLDQYQEILREQGVNIRYTWVKGHNGNLGNGMADYFASVAVRSAMEYFQDTYQNLDTTQVLEEVTEAKNYWQPEVERHPFLHFKRVYFNRKKELNEPGRYFLIEPNDEDMTIGKRSHEAYAVVRLTQPCKALESVIDAQAQFGQSENRVILALMDRVYNKFVYKFSQWFGRKCFFPSQNKREVLFCDMAPVALEHNPPLLIYRSTEILLQLDQMLDEYLRISGDGERDPGEAENPFHPVIHDVTHEFYTVEQKKVKDEMVQKTILKSDIGVGYKNHLFHIEEEDVDGKSRKIKIPMALGMDLPNRNQLKRLEDDQPKVYLLTWKDSDVSMRYAFVIDCLSGTGIWSNYFCDRVFLQP